MSQIKSFDPHKASRLFPQHSIRRHDSFHDGWKTWFPAQGTVIPAEDWQGGVEADVPVPGVWEMLDSRKNYRGQAVARKTFRQESRSTVRFVFRGVSHTAEVYLDGARIATHHNAFTGFAAVVADLEPGDHEVLVHISNEHGEISALHVPNDYYNYGGISRPVDIQRIDGHVFIEHVHFIPRVMNGQRFAEVEVMLQNLGSAVHCNLQFAIAGNRHRIETFGLRPGANKLRTRFAVEGIEDWSPESPQLYFLDTVVEIHDKPVDDLTERVGFRIIEAVGEEIHLNGKPIFICGLNRHEDHPETGCALTLEQMEADLELFRKLNANAVRTSHYPNDQRFLDLCDEMGFLVWEENHARGLNHSNMMKHPRFREQCEQCNAEMVTQHFNHPSIIMWGILNECESYSGYGRMCYAEQFRQIRNLDDTRPTTYASCFPDTDCCQDLPDICGWNLYSRWYGNRDPREDLEQNYIANAEPRGMAGKPFIIAESGAGAIPGYSDPVRRAKWSEERQADILDDLLGAYLNHPRVAGIFIWQFCDVRVDESWAPSRPRTMNNKGVVNEARVPKQAFETVARHFAAKRNLPA